MTITKIAGYFLVALLLAACSKPVTFTDLAGNRLTLTGDQWLVLNFWAQWCEPCRAEVPELNALASSGQVRVLGVDFDGGQGEELASRAKALDIRFPVLRESPLAALQLPAPQVLPATFIISPQGEVVGKLFGPQTRQSLEAELARLK